jgi:subtilisin family serine protease
MTLTPMGAEAQRVDHRVFEALRAPHYDHLPRAVPSGDGMPVLIELSIDPSVTNPRDALGTLPGVRVVRSYGRFVFARIDVVGAVSLASAPLVTSVRVARTSRPHLPLDRSAALLSLDAARGWASRSGAATDRFTGEGITIADLDSAIDVFHPAFFRGDAGYFDWIDVNGDGLFTLNMDAIDLDRDGMADPGETARLMRAATLDLSGGDASGARPIGFDPGIDWVFLDLDFNTVRDVGAAAGADDSTPGFGEPIFTPDDVDGDGRLDTNERLVRLGSSKIARFYVSVNEPRFGHEYVRGTDLSTVRSDYTGGVYGYADGLHATGVAGILIADLPLTHRRWVGIAPDAELYSSFYIGNSSVEPIMWSLEQGADVLLHEYVQWTREVLDGGDATGALIDASTVDGAVHVCPAGNIGGMGKHARIDATGGVSVDVPIDVPGDTAYWELTLHVEADALASLAVVEPNGTVAPFDDADVQPLTAGPGEIFGAIQTSDRGRTVRTMILYSDGAPLATGRHFVRVMLSRDARIDVLLADAQGFARGVSFPDDVASDDATLAWPATSDACITVGSTPAHLSSEGRWFDGGREAAGEVRDYSARGPRIDGELGLHVLAPDNPWSSLCAGEIYPDYPGYVVAPGAAYQVFGGTSGAGPHVAGVAALLVGAGLRGAAVRERIMATAIDDGLGGTLPNGDYGAGRIDALRALAAGATEDGGEPPTVSLSAPSYVPLGSPITFTASASDPEGSEVTLRWDQGYDGTWDGEYGPSDTLTFTPSEEGFVFVKVRARDAFGRIAEAAARVQVGGEAPDAGTPDAGPGGGGDGGCGCSAQRRGPSPFTLIVLSTGAALLLRPRSRRSARS